MHVAVNVCVNYKLQFFFTFILDTSVGAVGDPGLSRHCSQRAGDLTVFSRSTDVTSTDLVSAKGKTKEVFCCDVVVLIVLF